MSNEIHLSEELTDKKVEEKPRTRIGYKKIISILN